jgi:hypothetical protein
MQVASGSAAARGDEGRLSALRGVGYALSRRAPTLASFAAIACEIPQFSHHNESCSDPMRCNVVSVVSMGLRTMRLVSGHR